MSKHTPGQWNIFPYYCSGQHYTVQANGQDIGRHTGHGWALTKADANLIAAAPDLYESLSVIVKWLNREMPDGMAQATMNARAALAKASP